jgi:hypothetical protein
VVVATTSVPPTFLNGGALDAVVAHLLQEFRVAEHGGTASARVSNCLNTVNSTMAMTSQTATFENH